MYPFNPFSTPTEMMKLAVRSAMTLAEAQAVIAMRLAGMMGLWRVTPQENDRMLSEKLAAVRESSLAAARATMAGKSPAAVADQALKPYRRRTRANAQRLTKRGPGTPD
ncbi:antifreeze protein [Xinfangfangia pollutisoli]|uniref:antifreeze protein n=1 Tax=Xinfangfangia pollutisoli TaxID=2865960 RepID=UPI001CD3941C|nr:antifreeze protein [Xinfangfangia pollutisoli]